MGVEASSIDSIMCLPGTQCLQSGIFIPNISFSPTRIISNCKINECTNHIIKLYPMMWFVLGYQIS